jgi:hypothetical protein
MRPVTCEHFVESPVANLPVAFEGFYISLVDGELEGLFPFYARSVDWPPHVKLGRVSGTYADL